MKKKNQTQFILILQGKSNWFVLLGKSSPNNLNNKIGCFLKLASIIWFCFKPIDKLICDLNICEIYQNPVVQMQMHTRPST